MNVDIPHDTYIILLDICIYNHIETINYFIIAIPMNFGY